MRERGRGELFTNTPDSGTVSQSQWSARFLSLEEQGGEGDECSHTLLVTVRCMQSTVFTGRRRRRGKGGEGGSCQLGVGQTA